ncbi:MAG: hypothetical protein ABWY05_14220, partial [Noviherbaspirillum sp.]
GTYRSETKTVRLVSTNINGHHFDTTVQVAGALAVFGPSARLNAERVSEYGQLLVASTNEISNILGDRSA